MEETSGCYVSLVIPAYNEQENIPMLLDRVEKSLSQIGKPFEVILIDDGSSDLTPTMLSVAMQKLPWLRVLRMQKNAGQSAAFEAGFEAARGKFIATIDADLQNDPEEIPRLLDMIERESVDMISGWRKDRQDTPFRRWQSRQANRIRNWITQETVNDSASSLKVYRAEVFREVRLYGELHRFIPVLAHYRGFRIAELPVNHRPREHGRSRYGVERYLRGFLDLLTVSFIGRYRHRPLHLFGGFGLLLGLIGSAILVYLTVIKALGHAIGQRPLLMLGVLLVVIGMQFFSLGLISEMITSHHEERAQERDRAELLVDEILS
jgi:glycosyltransferase involved in cell wall biosynthesis